MKKKICRGCAVLLACTMLAGLLMTTAFARASDYLATSAWIRTTPSLFSVAHTLYMAK